MGSFLSDRSPLKIKTLLLYTKISTKHSFVCPTLNHLASMGKKARNPDPRFASYIQKSFRENQKSHGVGANGVAKLTISANALSAAELLIDHFVDLLAQNSELIVKYGKSGTLKVKHMHAATNIAMSGRLGEQALQMGALAVENYSKAQAAEAAEAEARVEAGAEAEAVAA